MGLKLFVGIRNSSSTSSSDSCPILEVPNRWPKNTLEVSTSESAISNSPVPPASVDEIRQPVLTSSVATLGGIFGENDNDDEESGQDEISRELEQILMSSSVDGGETEGAVRFKKMTSSNSTMTSTMTNKSDDDKRASNGEQGALLVNTQAAGGLYFK